jgi:hypothetical protein
MITKVVQAIHHHPAMVVMEHRATVMEHRATVMERRVTVMERRAMAVHRATVTERPAMVGHPHTMRHKWDPAPMPMKSRA